MKLHENQLNLIRHLIRFNILSYEDCLSFLDTENSGDMIAMSYAFRPLTKNGYVVKNRDGVVAILQKGRELFPDEFPLISVATHGKSRLRVWCHCLHSLQAGGHQHCSPAGDLPVPVWLYGSYSP